MTWGGYTEKRSAIKELDMRKPDCARKDEEIDVDKLEEISKAHAEQSFYIYSERDELDRQKAKTYIPEAIIKKFPAGPFLVVMNHEIPARFIEKIEVSGTGRAPGIGKIPRERFYGGSGAFPASYDAYPAASARITVTMHSGVTYLIECNRHIVDMLYSAMKEAWKNAPAK